MVEAGNRPQPSSIDTDMTSPEGPDSVESPAGFDATVVEPAAVADPAAAAEPPALAEPAVAPVTLQPETVLDRRYRLLNPVTTRGPVTLWRGDDEVLARAVAVRVVEHAGPLVTAPGGVGREQAGRMLLEAAVNSGRLVHPGAASTYDATVTSTESGPVSYVVSEWVDGKTLRQLASDGSMSPSQVASVVLAAARVIAAAHDRGIHHGDLHPGDVIVSSHGTVKVIDIEIGGVLSKLDGSGTPPSEGDPQRDDVRALGALLYAGLTGCCAFRDGCGLPAAPTSADGRLRSPRQVRSSIPRDLDAVTLAALGDERSAGSEISTADELVEELAAIAPGDAVFDPGLLRLDGATGTQAMPSDGYGAAANYGGAGTPAATSGLPATSAYDASDFGSRGYPASDNYGRPRQSGPRTAPERYASGQGYPPAPPPRAGGDRASGYGDRPPPYREPDRRSPASPRGPGGPNRRPLVLVILLVVVLVGGGLVAWRLTSDKGTPTATPTAAGTTAPATGAVLTPASVRSYDPLTEDAEKTESPEKVDNAVDGNPSTVWPTSSYNQQLADRNKAGVGLLLEFDQPVTVSQISVTFSGGATDFQLRASDSDTAAVDGFPVAAEQTGVTETAVVQVNAVGAHRYWVLWLTKLPQQSDGKFKGTVVDLSLRS